MTKAFKQNAAIGLRLIGIIAFVAVMGFSLAACDDGNGAGGTGGGGQNPGGGGSNPTNYSLNGVWKWQGWIVTINGSTGIVTQLPSGTNGATLDAINKGFVKVGSTFFRNLSHTGDRTWTGQESDVQKSDSNPNVAVGTGWSGTFTFTLSADGQSFQVFEPGNSTPLQTWTRTSAANLSLDGVWKWAGWTVNINGTSGLVTQFPAQTNALGQDAVNKGYIKIGMVYIRNITKKEDGTWSCEICEGISYDMSNPNVAVGLIINNRTITLSADGQTFQVFESGNSTPRATWTRQ
jgi:hypothetical protein